MLLADETLRALPKLRSREIARSPQAPLNAIDSVSATSVRRWIAVVAALVILHACGGGGGDLLPSNPNQAELTSVELTSDSGDPIGQGRTFSCTPASADISVVASGGHLAVVVKGDQQWFGDFQIMSGLNKLKVGRYADLERHPFHDSTRGGISW